MADEESSDRFKERIGRMAAKIKDAESAAAAAEAGRAEFEKRVAELEGIIGKHQETEGVIAAKDAEIASMRRGFDTERAIITAGITDQEGIEMAKHFHGKLGEAAPPMSEWLQGDNLPRGVAAYIPAPTAPAPAPTEPTAPPRNPVAANAGATPAPNYDGQSKLKDAISTTELWRANRDQFVGPDGRLKS